MGGRVRLWALENLRAEGLLVPVFGEPSWEELVPIWWWGSAGRNWFPTCLPLDGVWTHLSQKAADLGITNKPPKTPRWRWNGGGGVNDLSLPLPKGLLLGGLF